jgi:2'-5' RNA ligase
MNDVHQTESHRCFVAIGVETSVLDRLQALRERLERHFGGRAFRWAGREQMHLTLRFLGEVPADQMDGLEAALKQACQSVGPFTLRAEGLGCFPHSGRPRVIWVGVNGATQPLKDLHLAINQYTAGWGKPVEDRPFHPHLTLARAKQVHPGDARQLERFLREYETRSCGEWEVKKVSLMKSELRREGAEYTELAAIPLGGVSSSGP